MTKKVTQKQVNKVKADERLSNLEKQVREIKLGHINEETLFALVVSGHLVYKQGMGLSHDSVIEAIKKGLEEDT